MRFSITQRRNPVIDNLTAAIRWFIYRTYRYNNFMNDPSNFVFRICF